MSSRRRPSRDELALAPTRGETPVWDASGQGRVNFRTRRLEPRLAFAISIYTVWAAVVLNPGTPVVWLLALFAATIGAWCRTSPAQYQWQMLLRAALLLAGAFVLQISADTGGPDGPHFVWDIMVVTVYSLLLSRRWAMALWALALLEFGAARIWASTAPSWQLSMAQLGMLSFFAFIAAEYGRSMRELDQQAEAARRDRNSRLYNEAGFFAHGGQLFDDCRGRKRPFSLVLLNSSDLREVSDLSGKKAANHVFAQLVQSMAAATPPEGIAARTDAAEFALALPGVSAAKAAALLQKQLGQPTKIEVTLKGNKLTVMLDTVIAESTPDVASLEDMYDRLRRKLLHRAGEESFVPAEAQSTLQGMWEGDSVIPHNARPTMPMTYASEAVAPPKPKAKPKAKVPQR